MNVWCRRARAQAWGAALACSCSCLGKERACASEMESCARGFARWSACLCDSGRGSCDGGGVLLGHDCNPANPQTNNNAMLARGVSLQLACALALFVCSLSLPLPLTTSSTPTPAIVTTSGPIRGTISDAVSSFLGVPFAAPPRRCDNLPPPLPPPPPPKAASRNSSPGSLRFQPPVPPSPWSDVKDVTTQVSLCPPRVTPPLCAATSPPQCPAAALLLPSIHSHSAPI